jgi:ABC-2 type transport system permease protein
MTGLLESPTAGKPKSGRSPFRLMAAEVMKIRTTNTWWLFGIGMVLVTALAFTRNAFNNHFILHPPLNFVGEGQRREILAQAAAAHTPEGLAKIAADMMTSGQFFGLLFALIIGILVVTNEFFHQTATTTFMTVPHRTAIILAKAVAATLFGALFWLVATVLDLVATPIFLHSEHLSVSITEWTVVRSVLLNLAAFVIWAVFGLGLGTLLRSQIGSVITGISLYLVGSAAVLLIVGLVHNLYPHDWIFKLAIVAPAVASQIMITPGGSGPPQNLPEWSGAVALIGYAVVTGLVGTLIMRKRDIS